MHDLIPSACTHNQHSDGTGTCLTCFNKECSDCQTIKRTPATWTTGMIKVSDIRGLFVSGLGPAWILSQCPDGAYRHGCGQHYRGLILVRPRPTCHGGRVKRICLFAVWFSF